MKTALGVLLLSASLAAAQAPSQVEQRARDIFRELVAINTTESAGDTTRAAEAMAQRLRAAGFPNGDIRILGPAPHKNNLIARFKGTGARPPVLLLAHLDVVEARKEDWSFEPFVLTERDGYFYGRGTSDDKDMASQLVANLIRLKEERFRPDRDLILALTADEETGPDNGVRWLLKTHRDLIDAAFAVNEGGGGVSRNGKYLVNEVQAAEKVYQDFSLEITNPGGHSSLPTKDNAIVRLGAALARLGAHEFPIRLNEITRGYLDRSAAVQTDAATAADMRAAATPEGDREAAARLAAGSPYFNAMMRTTCVPTRLQGGHANNALPQLASAVVNCRLLPGELPDIVREQIVAVLDDPAVAVKFIDGANTSEPAVLLPEVSEAVETVTRAMFPGVIIAPVMSTGATDGLFLRNAGIPTYGIGGTFGDIDDVRSHGRDERVGVKQYFEGLEFQYRLIKRLAGGT